MKNTLTSFLAGTLLLVGSAMAAQTSTSPKPAVKPAAKTTTASKTTGAKKVAHNKTKHSTAKKTVAKKNVAPATPVAAKK